MSAHLADWVPITPPRKTPAADIQYCLARDQALDTMIPATKHCTSRNLATPGPRPCTAALHCTALHCSTDSDGEHNSNSATLDLTLLPCCCWRWLHHLQLDFRGLVERSYLQACFWLLTNTKYVSLHVGASIQYVL